MWLCPNNTPRQAAGQGNLLTPGLGAGAPDWGMKSGTPTPLLTTSVTSVELPKLADVYLPHLTHEDDITMSRGGYRDVKGHSRPLG